MVARTRSVAKKTVTQEVVKEPQVEHAKRYGNVAEIREYVENPPKGAKYSRAMVVRLLEEIDRLDKMVERGGESEKIEELQRRNEILTLVLSGASMREVLEKALVLLGVDSSVVLKSLAE